MDFRVRIQGGSDSGTAHAGPLAAQLAIYLGYVHYGVLGATLVGVIIVLPASFLMVVAAWLGYVTYGGISWMQAVFYGVGASVIGIITISAYKLTQKTIGTNRLMWVIYLAAPQRPSLESESVWLFLGAGLVVWAIRTPPWKKSSTTTSGIAFPTLAMVPAAKASLNELLTQIAIFFTKAGAFVFGSGLAIVPFCMVESSKSMLAQ